MQLRESLAGAPAESTYSQISDNTRRMLDAIESLPDDEREVFDLVRIQGMNQADAAEVLGVSTKTVHRRLVRCLTMLTGKIGDLRTAPESGESV